MICGTSQQKATFLIEKFNLYQLKYVFIPKTYVFYDLYDMLTYARSLCSGILIRIFFGTNALGQIDQL